MDGREREILARFELRTEEIAGEIAAATVAEVANFAPVRDDALESEIQALADQHIRAFVNCARTGAPPAPETLASARERAARRAREMVPLSALLHSYLIAQRIITAEITRQAGPDAPSRGAALALTAKTFDYNIAVTSAMAEAYIEVVQGDLAELESARRELIDSLLTSGATVWPELTRRAAVLGFDPQRRYVTVIACLDLPGGEESQRTALRWAAGAIARASGRPQRQAFIVSQDHEVVGLLDAEASNRPEAVLERVAASARQARGGLLRAGLGCPFVGLDGFVISYHEARRALRHTDERRPTVVTPDGIGVFDELIANADPTTARLVPDATRDALTDPTLRRTLSVFIEADLNVAAAAKGLALHPNSLRYRLRKIHEISGRDPRNFGDLIELVAAARIIDQAARNDMRSANANRTSPDLILNDRSQT